MPQESFEATPRLLRQRRVLRQDPQGERRLFFIPLRGPFKAICDSERSEESKILAILSESILLRQSFVRGLLGCALWMFAETSAGIMRVNKTFIAMPLRQTVRVLLVATGLLIVPLTASFFVDGWNWGVGGYIFAWVMFASAGLGFTFVAGRGNSVAYKVATGLAVAAAFLLVWSNLAVGVIGEDNPANALYFAVLLVGMIGAGIARFQPQGMARALFAVAAAQMLVPVVALILWRNDFAPGVMGVFMLNGVFAVLWAGSALLFRRAT